MLRCLQIENYGLIARAEVDFVDGATIFTGETGSGKTMLMGALDFALGARAGPDVVRRETRKAVVTLLFEPDDALREQFRVDGFELDAGEEGSISREMTDAGRSAVRVNGRAATAAYVRDIADAIAEIVGQHEAQRLLSPAYHRELLDRFSGETAERLRDAMRDAYRREQAAAQALTSLTQHEQRARQLYEDAQFIAREIEAARLEPGEFERLSERSRYLDNVERIALALQTAREALAGEDQSACTALGKTAAALAGIEQFNAAFASMEQRAAALQAEADELTRDIAAALETTEFDPAEHDAIHARLDLLDRLKRKYGGDVADLLEVGTRAREVLDEYEGRDRSIAQHRSELEAVRRELQAVAASLTALRRASGLELSRRVVNEFADMALGSASFGVAIEPLESISAEGAERVAFLFAANSGETARPLARVASGGELSRVLLALVAVLTGTRDGRGALVFDEIDAGIGGATAISVGARIGALARREQIVCVTHLAALATWADRHYVLDKLEHDAQTTIAVRKIGNAKEREAEIARMLSGEGHDVALRHARAMLQLTKR